MSCYNNLPRWHLLNLFYIVGSLTESYLEYSPNENLHHSCMLLCIYVTGCFSSIRRFNLAHFLCAPFQHFHTVNKRRDHLSTKKMAHSNRRIWVVGTVPWAPETNVYICILKSILSNYRNLFTLRVLKNGKWSYLSKKNLYPIAIIITFTVLDLFNCN